MNVALAGSGNDQRLNDASTRGSRVPALPFFLLFVACEPVSVLFLKRDASRMDAHADISKVAIGQLQTVGPPSVGRGTF